MKKRIKEAKGFLCGVLATALLFSNAPVLASAITRQITVASGHVRLVVDGQRIQPLDAQGNIVEPFIFEGTTFVPVRAIAGLFGVDTSWDSSTSTVYLNSIGSTTPATPTPPVVPPPNSEPVPTSPTPTTTPQTPTAIQPGEGSLIYEDANVRITFAGVRVSPDRWQDEEIQFFVENRTAARLSFQSNSMSLNGMSLGHVSGSPSIAPHSSVIIRFRTAEAFPTMNPSTISGSMVVIDFDRTITADQQSHRVAEITFTNISVD